MVPKVGKTLANFGAKCCGFSVYAGCGRRPHAASTLNPQHFQPKSHQLVALPQTISLVQQIGVGINSAQSPVIEKLKIFNSWVSRLKIENFQFSTSIMDLQNSKIENFQYWTWVIENWKIEIFNFRPQYWESCSILELQVQYWSCKLKIFNFQSANSRIENFLCPPKCWCDFGAKCCGFRVYAACGLRPKPVAFWTKIAEFWVGILR